MLHARLRAAAGNMGDPLAGSVVSLLYLDTDATDETGKIWSELGVSFDPAVSEDGNGSARFTGTGGSSSTAGDYLRSPAHSDFIIGSQDFTLEHFIRINSYPSVAGSLYDFRPPSTNGPYINASVTPSGELSLYVNTGTRLTTAATLSLGAWYHVALERHAGETRFYIDGVSSGGFWADGTDYAGDRLTTGASQYHLALTADRSFGVDGWVDNQRITIGAARYKSDFTPPTAPLPY